MVNSEGSCAAWDRYVMHELSLATAMMTQLEEVLRREQAEVIVRVELELGAMSGVDAEAFEFAFPMAAEGGPAQGAELVLREVPLQVYCPACKRDGRPQPPMLYCVHCGNLAVQVTAGRDFLIKSLEVR